MRFFAKSFLKFGFVLCASLLSLSCAHELNVNQAFEKKYGREMEKIRAERTPTAEQNIQFDRLVNFPAPTTEEIANAQAADSSYYPYVDISKFGERSPQIHLPNGEFYEQARANNPSNSLPPNIFEVTYNTHLHPPFRRIGGEFDLIAVPQYDVYGVPTAMAEKTYLLAGGEAMQKSIDRINNEKTKDDVEISEILIREQKQLKRKEKMVKIFGKNDLIEIASLEKKSDKKSDKKTEDKSEIKKSDSLQTQENSVAAANPVKN